MAQPVFSRYKDPAQAIDFLTQWNQQLQQLNQLTYDPLSLPTDWGQTRVWVHTPKRRVYQTLVLFPGFQTPALSWDLTGKLAPLKLKYRLVLVEINGQPNLSEGHSPPLQTDAMGRWAAQVLDQLNLRRPIVIGHAMGAFIVLKLCQLAPQRVQQAILINPAGIQPLKLSYSLLRYYRLAMASPSQGAIRTFLRQAVFSPLEPCLPIGSEALLIAYHQHALSEFRFSTWWNKPLAKEELLSIVPRVDLLLGATDRFFAYQTTLERARQYLPSLGSVTVLPRMGHGTQHSAAAIVSLEAMLGYGSSSSLS